MKTIKLTGKLSLNKETIAKLNDDQMNRIEGGCPTVYSRCTGCNPTACFVCSIETGAQCNTSASATCQ